MKAIIIHGTLGHPEENWFPWLSYELEQAGFQVIAPKFPTPKNQNLDSWLEVIKRYTIDQDTILIGHSLGCAFILTLLECNVAKSCYLVSGFVGPLNNEKFDPLNKTFAEKEFNWNNIKLNCNSFTLFHSDNDPYVPIEKAQELKEKLDGELIILKDRGHFNQKEFEEIKEKIITQNQTD